MQWWPSEKHYFYLETSWHKLYAALQEENIKLKVLEICSVSVRKDVVGVFSRCVMSGLGHLTSWDSFGGKTNPHFLPLLHQTNQYPPSKAFPLKAVQLIIGSLSISFLVLTTKLEKVKLSDEDWKIFLEEIGQANSNSVLSVLHLSECWPSDETLQVFHNQLV